MSQPIPTTKKRTIWTRKLPRQLKSWSKDKVKRKVPKLTKKLKSTLLICKRSFQAFNTKRTWLKMPSMDQELKLQSKRPLYKLFWLSWFKRLLVQATQENSMNLKQNKKAFKLKLKTDRKKSTDWKTNFKMSTQNSRKFKDQLEILQKNWILSDLKLKVSIRKKLKLKSKLKASRKNTMKLWTKSKITKKILISKSQKIISWTIKLNICKKRKMIWSTKFHNIKRKNLSLKKKSQKSCST